MSRSPALTGRAVHTTRGSETLPVLVYLHGGGWVAGSVATHDPFCRLLSEAAGVIVASVEYRLAPEHPHPAALEDALAAVHWAANNAAQWGGEASRLALGGDSAGGHLAAAAANRLCATAGAPRLRALLLLYPATDHPSGNHLSYTENETGYGLEDEPHAMVLGAICARCFAGRSRCVTASITYTASASPNFGGNGGV